MLDYSFAIFIQNLASFFKLLNIHISSDNKTTILISLITSTLGTLVTLLLSNLFKHRALKVKIIHERPVNCYQETTALIYNPNIELASIYGFEVKYFDGTKVKIDRRRDAPHTRRDLDVEIYCANAPEVSIEEVVTYINPKNVYPLAIAVNSVNESPINPIVEIIFYSKTCGFFLSKLQSIFPNLEKKYHIHLPKAYSAAKTWAQLIRKLNLNYAKDKLIEKFLRNKKWNNTQNKIKSDE